MDSVRRRFAIVGAGLAGAATAYHLRLAGVTDVVVLEREDVPGAHSSGRNAAILREHMEETGLRDLATASAAVLRGGALAPFHACGNLLVGLGTDDVARRLPWARGRARFAPGDGVLDVAALLQTYLRGVEVRCRHEVRSFRAGPDGVRVETSGGPFDVDVLVNAAGPWAGVFGDLPLTPTNRHLFLGTPPRPVDPGWPILWDPGHGYYLRPEPGGLLLCACDETPAAPGDYAIDPAVHEDLARKLARWQPALGEPRITRCWVGQRTFARDRLPVVGFDQRTPRLFHIAALGGHGVTLSWSIGARAAGLLLGGFPARDDPADALRPARVLARR